MTRSRLRATLALPAWLGLAGVALAQAGGSLRGTVTDPSGAVVPGAELALADEATQFVRRAKSDSQGEYYLGGLPPGDYTLTAAAPGFKVAEVRGIHVSPNDTSGADLCLEIGSQRESVEVTAAQAIIATETGAREGLLTADQIEALSTIGRNPMELMRILPGTVTPDQNAMELAGKFSGAGATASTTVNGIRGTNMMVSLDGARLQDVGANNGTLVALNSAMVSEVKFQTSNYAAEFGSAAVNVQAITKAGSSEFHAGLYSILRDHRLSTNDLARARAGGQKPKSRFQFPGVYLSGPLLIPGTRFNRGRDKLFFFVAGEVARQQVDQGTSFSIVPTLGQRQGLFDDYQGGQNLNQSPVVMIPFGFPGAGTPAPNNDLRPYLTETGRQLLSLWPEPNFVDTANRYNYVFDDLSDVNRDEEVVRLDWNVSRGTHAFFRFVRDYESSQRHRGLWSNTSDVALPTPVRSTSLGWSLSAGATSVLSSSATNEATVSWSCLKIDNRWANPEKMLLATYGIEDLENPFWPSPYVPQLVMQDSGGSLYNQLDVENVFAYSELLSVADSLTRIVRGHALKAGVTVERWQKQQNASNAANARLTFGINAPGSTGVDFGDVLVGRPLSATIGTPAAVGKFVSWGLEAYLQDSWKVVRRFTLEYGLRFARWTNNEETGDLGAIFQPARYDGDAGLFVDADATRLNGLAYASRGEVDRALTGSRPLLWMPRLGFVWDVAGNGRTVIRGGGGLFYNREQGNAQYGVIGLPPNAYSTRLSASALTWLAGGEGLTYRTLGQADPLGALNTFSIASVSPTELGWPRTLTASLSVAQRLGWRQVLELGYVGSFGRHLAQRRNINVIPPGHLLEGTVGNADLSVPLQRVALEAAAVDAQRPFPALQSVSYFTPSGVSNYHSLQATLGRQSGSFRYLLAYTFSKSLGTLAGDLGAVDPLDPRNHSYGVLPTDRTHVANLSWSWDLGAPAKRGKVLKALLNGWRLSGISTYMSGSPIRLTFSGDIAGAAMSQAWWGTPDYTNAIMPVYSCDPRRSTPDGAFLDIGCIGIPSFGESGPFVQPYYLRAPSSSFHDLTLLRDFKLRLRGKVFGVQLRLGVFDVFNQAFASVPGDVDLRLDTRCNVRVDGVPNGIDGTRDNVCDPTGGFSYTPQTLENFATAIAKHGRRVVSLGLKLDF
jgi:hypothetical protein